MNYIEALQALICGKKVRDKRWVKDEYVYLKHGDITTNYGDRMELTAWDIYDITNDNWELYQAKENKLITDGKRWKLLRACEMCGCENCERKQKELYKFCQRSVGSFDEILIRASDDVVNSIYNLLKIKGELDA